MKQNDDGHNDPSPNANVTYGDPPGMGGTTDNVHWGDPPATADPLGVTAVLYAAGPLPGTYAYAAPPMDPWQPAPPLVPSITLKTPCNHAEEFKRLEEHLCRIERMLEQVLTGLKVREACDEMLKKLGETRTP